MFEGKVLGEGRGEKGISKLSKLSNFRRLCSYDIGSAPLTGTAAVIPPINLFLTTTGDTIAAIALYGNFVEYGIPRRKVA